MLQNIRGRLGGHAQASTKTANVDTGGHQLRICTLSPGGDSHTVCSPTPTPADQVKYRWLSPPLFLPCEILKQMLTV